MTETYLATLCTYYEEEVEGEAYFACLAERFDAPEHKRKLTLLAQVERHAAEAVRPLVEAYGLSPKPLADLVRSGRADAMATPLDWAALLDEMNATYTGYLQDFKDLEAMAPRADRAALAYLTEHEVAGIAFLDLETRQTPDSAAPLRFYLSQGPDHFTCAAE